MNTSLKISTCLAFGLALVMPAHAQDEDEKAADLNAYSVGDTRTSILDQQKVEIERPTFNSDFKFEIAKPALSNIKMAKPKLEVIEVAEANSGANSGATSATTPPAASSGAGPAVDASAGGGETRSIQPLSMAPPEFPVEAFRNRSEGYVVVEFTVTTAGTTQDIEVVEAKPRGEFERAARRAVADWRFEPALRNGQPISQRIRHTIEFTLAGQ